MSRPLEETLDSLDASLRSRDMDSMSTLDLAKLATKLEKVEPVYIERHRASLAPLRVGVLASFTTHPLAGILKLLLYRLGVAPRFYEGGYDSIARDLMDTGSGLYRFEPQALLLLPYHADVKEYPEPLASEEEVARWVGRQADFVEALWRRAAAIPRCHVYQGTFVAPFARPLGNLECNYLFTRSNCLKALELELVRRRPAGVTLLDLDHLASFIGKSVWFDEPGYFANKQGLSFGAAGPLARLLARLLAAQAGKVKKCLVLDLDETLWGGIAGDDGVDGIVLDPNDAVGEAYLAFQRYVKRLKERGVILAVASKNDEAIARAPFIEHPHMVLRLDDIACFVANWDPKPANLRLIAERLNIGTDSLVFFDDNPGEREIVRRFLPEVEVVEVPEDPALFVRALDRATCFEWNQMSREDLTRSETYVSEQRREELRGACADYDSYLRSLEMAARVGPVEPREIARFTQLVNRTNQFNLRTRRYPEASIARMAGEIEGHALIATSLRDKFSDYGLISAVILEKAGDEAFIDTWVMSCRVLKRGVEAVALNGILAAARRLGCSWVVGQYVPTAKNGLVATLFAGLGFEPSADAGGGEGARYRIASSAAERSHHIEVVTK